MPGKLYPHTQFCVTVEGSTIRSYGFASDELLPPGFAVGDLVKLCIRTNEHGFLTPEVVLEEGMFNPLHLDGIGVVTEDGLYTVIRVEGRNSNVSNARAGS